MARQRFYSIEFKRQVAQEFVAGEILYGLSKRHVGSYPNSSFSSALPARRVRANTRHRVIMLASIP